MPDAANIQSRRIIRGSIVEDKTSWTRVTIWRAIRDNKFPAPNSAGPNSVGWFEDEIDTWLATRPRPHLWRLQAGGRVMATALPPGAAGID